MTRSKTPGARSPNAGLGPEAPDEFTAMVQIESGALLSCALRLTKNLPDAWDLFQDTIERAFRSKRRETVLPNAKPWLLTIMQNLFIDRCRSASVRRTQPLTPALLETLARVEPESPAPAMWRSVNEEAVNRSIRALPAKMLAIFTMKREGFSYAQIAAHFQMKITTVGTCLNRARSRIRTLMFEHAADPLAADVRRGCTGDVEPNHRPRRLRTVPVDGSSGGSPLIGREEWSALPRRRTLSSSVDELI
jgi:RNA polymerase sigma-70 factor (ECF subfamily)